MKMYKVGDTVKILRGRDGNYACIGKTGTIIYMDPGINLYDVEFIDKFDGHSGYSDMGESGHVWTYKHDDFEPCNKYIVELI